jgi:AcrR family transcriptional regulator
MTEPIKKKYRASPFLRRGGAKPKRAERLLTVALELFSKSDFSAVSIKKIADEAGVNSSLIYYYFDSKEILFQAALERAVLQTLQNYEMLRERHNNPAELISDWFDTHIVLAEPIKKLVKIMLDYSTSGTQHEVIDSIIYQFYKEESQLLSASIEWGIKLDLFNAVDPLRAARLASTFLDGAMTRALIMPTLDVAEVINDLKDVFWEHLGYDPTSKSKGCQQPVHHLLS